MNGFLRLNFVKSDFNKKVSFDGENGMRAGESYGATVSGESNVSGGSTVTPDTTEHPKEGELGPGKSPNVIVLPENSTLKPPVLEECKLWMDIQKDNCNPANGLVMNYVAPMYYEGGVEIEIEVDDMASELQF